MLRKYFHSGSYSLISSRPNPLFILRDICHTKVRFCFHLKSRLRFGCFCLSDSHFLSFDISCKKNIFWIEIKFFSIRWLSDRKRIACQLKSTWNHEVYSANNHVTEEEEQEEEEEEEEGEEEREEEEEE